MDTPVHDHKLDVAFVVENSTALAPSAAMIRFFIIRCLVHMKSYWLSEHASPTTFTMRARLITYSDFASDGAKAVRGTDFFDIETQRDGFTAAVQKLPFTYNNFYGAQNGPEALYAAMTSDRSKFVVGRDYGRNAIVVIAKYPPLNLYEQALCLGYPQKVMPKTLKELEELWNNDESGSAVINQKKKRAVFVMPYLATDDVGHSWENVFSWDLCTPMFFDFSEIYKKKWLEFADAVAHRLSFED